MNLKAFPYSHESEFNSGMTLRDYFAAAAMQGYCAKGIPGTAGKIAEMSYEMAEAMLEARKKGQ